MIGSNKSRRQVNLEQSIGLKAEKEKRNGNILHTKVQMLIISKKNTKRVDHFNKENCTKKFINNFNTIPGQLKWLAFKLINNNI